MLVAYYVLREQADLQPGELMKALRGKLPGFMVPQVFMRLEAIPSSGHHVFLTHTRRCLRAIEAFLADTGDTRRREAQAEWRGEATTDNASGGR